MVDRITLNETGSREAEEEAQASSGSRGKGAQARVEERGGGGQAVPRENRAKWPRCGGRKHA